MDNVYVYTHFMWENLDGIKYCIVDFTMFFLIEDLYDHLDFLRPTVSWKPHYQSALVLQDLSGGSSSKKGETT